MFKFNAFNTIYLGDWLIRKTSVIFFLLFLILLIAPIHAGDADNATKTFTDLNATIDNQESHVSLDKDYYRFNSSSDDVFKEGVVISRNMTLSGNGSVIDGNHEVRCLMIESNCSVVLENLTFMNGFTDSNGAGVYMKQNSSLILRNCIFKNNKVYNSNGGGLSAAALTNTDIYNCIFENNTSIRESDKEWDQFKRGMGSAICSNRGSNLKMYDSVFKSNNAYLSTILLISYDDVLYNISTLYLKNCTFEDNFANSSGVIYQDEMGIGTYLDSIFRRNRVVESGGTLILDAAVSAVVKNCLFEENSGEKGGAIHIKVYDYSYVSNVTVSDCNFTKNHATVWGGAISAKYGLASIDNCRFIENTADSDGGAFFTKLGTITLTNSYFAKNTAPYGGALYVKDGEAKVMGCKFTQNSATTKGGAVFSKILTITSDNCNYISNVAPKGANVYGAFLAQISPASSYFGTVELTIRLSSPWKMPLSQKIKVKFTTSTKTYKTKWLKTDSNGFLKFKAPFDLAKGTYTITITMNDGVVIANPASIKVVKAPTKVDVKKLKTTFRSGKVYQFHVINSKTNKRVSNAKVTLKIYTGKKYVKYTLKADENGFIKLDTSGLAVGKHTVKISAGDKNIKLSKTSSIKIKKAKAKFKSPKKVKRPKKIKITAQNKETGRAIKNTKLNLRITSNYDYKVMKVKTNSKGVFKISTKKLSRGKHNIRVTLKNKNYNIKKNLKVRIR